ncbi:hypothetical protein [Breznakiella homolactica]|uniref:Uncharacterized protein n=1 Tax=Breznakiella homolactica TaxID=2798577 RepID=A0A7T7XPG7_9SPIR|nr:hypothetical protein [Breznakiella homolactica]QQO10089.1 hypothetical protein JFL75_04000 [Breznakiella homolactica]
MWGKTKPFCCVLLLASALACSPAGSYGEELYLITGSELQRFSLTISGLRNSTELLSAELAALKMNSVQLTENLENSNLKIVSLSNSLETSLAELNGLRTDLEQSSDQLKTLKNSITQLGDGLRNMEKSRNFWRAAAIGATVLAAAGWIGGFAF